MRNKEEDLLNEIHEMKNLMEYMNGEVITEAVSNQELRQNAKQQARDTDTSGIENVREKEVIAALQQLIDKIKGDGNQYSPMVKKYTEKLWDAVNDGGNEVNEQIIEEDLTDEVISKYNIEALVDKIISQEKGRIDKTIIPMLFAKIGDRFKYHKKKKNK